MSGVKNRIQDIYRLCAAHLCGCSLPQFWVSKESQTHLIINNFLLQNYFFLIKLSEFTRNSQISLKKLDHLVSLIIMRKHSNNSRLFCNKRPDAPLLPTSCVPSSLKMQPRLTNCCNFNNGLICSALKIFAQLQVSAADAPGEL